MVEFMHTKQKMVWLQRVSDALKWDIPILTEANLNTKYGRTHHSNAAVITQPNKTIFNNNMEFFFRDTVTHVKHKSYKQRSVEERSGKSL